MSIPRQRHLPAVSCVALVLLSACQGTPETSSQGALETSSQPDTIGLGDELLIASSARGDECRVRMTGRESEGTQVDQFEIHCPGWNQPSGLIWRMPLIDRPQLAEMLLDEDLPLWQMTTASCDVVQETTIADRVPVLIRRCESSAGWPYLLIGVENGARDETYLAWVLPHLAGILEQFVAVQNGQIVDAQWQKAGSRSQLLLLAERELSVHGGQLTLTKIRDYEKFARLGTLYNHAGDFASAETAHRRALELQEGVLGKDHPALGITMAAIALNMSNQGKEEAARDLFERAEHLAQQSTDNDYARYAAYRSLYATKYDSPAAGLEYIQESQDLRMRMFGPQSGEVGYSYFVRGDILDKAGNHEAAIDSFNKALDTFQRQSDPIWSAFAYEWLAGSHRKLGDHQTAEAYAARAAETVELVFGEGVRLGQALSRLASIQRDAGRTSEASTTFQRAMEMARRDRTGVRYLQIDDVAPYLDLLLSEAERQPALADTYLSQAVTAAQIPRDRTTAKAVRLMAARLAESDPAVRGLARLQQDALAADQAARLALGREQLEGPQDRDPRREQQLKEQIQAASAEAASLERRLQAVAPHYGRLVTTEILSPEGIVGLLGPREATVQILVADEATFVFLIKGNGSIRGHKVDVTATRLHEATSQLRRGLDPTEGPPPFDLRRSYELYREILGPVDADLAGVEHLIFVPSGPLLSLPPAVLVRKAPRDGLGYESAAWLIRDMAVSVLPSISALQELRAVVQESRARRPFLGIGDPSFGGEGSRRGTLEQAANQCLEEELFDPSLLRGVAPLPETRDELRSLADSLGAGDDSLVLGGEASETTVRGAELDAYRVVAFATHGLLPNQLRCQSEPALVLTPPEVASVEDDGLLTSSEVAQLELDADWVVLSACNTAGPDGGLGGESLSGLARAFFYAGARALLVSHWAVESEPTVLLTTGTLERYAKEPTRGKAEALRQAELALLSQPATAHPARWAPFVLVGDGGPRPASRQTVAWPASLP